MGPILGRNIGLQYQQITVQRVIGSVHPSECTMMWCFNFVIHTMVTLAHNAHTHQGTAMYIRDTKYSTKGSQSTHYTMHLHPRSLAIWIPPEVVFGLDVSLELLDTF